MLSRSLRPLLTLLVVLHAVLAERMYYKGELKISQCGGKIYGPKAESGVEFLGRGSNPLPTARKSGERCEFNQRGLGKCFPPFSALRMASSDTIVNVVDAAIGGKTPCPTCVRPWITCWTLAQHQTLSDCYCQRVGDWNSRNEIAHFVKQSRASMDSGF